MITPQLCGQPPPEKFIPPENLILKIVLIFWKMKDTVVKMFLIVKIIKIKNYAIYSILFNAGF